jgi:hypothetical protein
MPFNHRSRRDQKQRLLPSGPEFSQYKPKQLLHGRQPPARSTGVQSYSCCRRARFSRMRSSRDLKTLTTQPKRCRSHTIIAKNLTGFQQVEVSAKSLILRMRVVLTRTMRSVGKRTSLQGPTAASALSPSPRSARRAYLRPDRWESICLPTPAARCFLAALGALEPRERNVFR